MTQLLYEKYEKRQAKEKKTLFFKLLGRWAEVPEHAFPALRASWSTDGAAMRDEIFIDTEVVLRREELHEIGGHFLRSPRPRPAKSPCQSEDMRIDRKSDIFPKSLGEDDIGRLVRNTGEEQEVFQFVRNDTIEPFRKYLPDSFQVLRFILIEPAGIDFFFERA